MGRVAGDNLAYITRDRQANRWRVFIDGQHPVGSFSDGTYGGPASSLRAAISYRNDHEPQYKTENPIDPEHLASALSGVYFVETEAAPTFQAQWKKDGKKYTRSRSIHVHGRREALRQVCLLRYEAKERDSAITWSEFWEAAKKRYL